jgi:hypothetical protein
MRISNRDILRYAAENENIVPERWIDAACFEGLKGQFAPSSLKHAVSPDMTLWIWILMSIRRVPGHWRLGFE